MSIGSGEKVMPPAAKEGLPGVVGELVARWRDAAERVSVGGHVFDTCADELEATLSALTAEAGKCETCGGHGVVAWHTGQTPEQFEQHSMDCPDCTTNAAEAGKGEVTDAMVEVGIATLRDRWSSYGKLTESTVKDVRAVLEAVFALSTATPAGEWLNAMLHEGVPATVANSVVALVTENKANGHD